MSQVYYPKKIYRMRDVNYEDIEYKETDYTDLTEHSQSKEKEN